MAESTFWSHKWKGEKKIKRTRELLQFGVWVSKRVKSNSWKDIFSKCDKSFILWQMFLPSAVLRRSTWLQTWLMAQLSWPGKIKTWSHWEREQGLGNIRSPGLAWCQEDRWDGEDVASSSRCPFNLASPVTGSMRDGSSWPASCVVVFLADSQLGIRTTLQGKHHTQALH